MLKTEPAREIIQNACTAFTRQTGIPVELLGGKNVKGLALRGRDARLVLTPEVRTRIAPPDALLPLLRDQQRERGRILVTPQVTDKMAEKFRENGVQFMDGAGNVYINHPPVYLFIKGNRVPARKKMPAIGRAFKQTGTRLLYVLLCDPGLERKPYRTIAAKAGVALGMVNWVMHELKELGFLLEVGKGRARQISLINKERLLERWVTAYAEQLRPRLVLGRFQGGPEWWKDARLDPGHAQWGGEVAAAKLAGHLVPQEVTIYVDRDSLAAILIPNQLKANPEGDVECLERFWRRGAIPPNEDTVHPLLVYADLVATGNQRNLETARMIYEQHIVQLIGEA